LSEIQKGLVGLSAMPQGLTRFGSIMAAGTAPLETKFVCEKSVAWAGATHAAHKPTAPAREPIKAPQVVANVLAMVFSRVQMADRMRRAAGYGNSNTR
jgi:hypothetical protein